MPPTSPRARGVRCRSPEPGHAMPSLLAIAAHPDDIEFCMAGTMLAMARRGWGLHCFNVCRGNLGSATIPGPELAEVRAREAQAARLRVRRARRNAPEQERTLLLGRLAGAGGGAEGDRPLDGGLAREPQAPVRVEERGSVWHGRNPKLLALNSQASLMFFSVSASFAGERHAVLGREQGEASSSPPFVTTRTRPAL